MTIRFTENEDLPAFPILAQNHAIAMGLTKREWFAGLALQGLLANVDFANSLAHEEAVEYADRLIKELNK